jgi:fumarate hydratase subunit beta
VQPVAQLDFRHGNTIERLAQLQAGASVELTGRVLSLRDASAARLAASLAAGEQLPTELDGQILYAVGPSPAQPRQVIGSAGPTSTARMARYCQRCSRPV